MKTIFSLCIASASALSMHNGEIVLFDKPESASMQKQLDEQLTKALSFLEKDFDGELESSLLSVMQKDLATFQQSEHYNGFQNQAECGSGSAGSLAPATIRAYPGASNGFGVNFNLANAITSLANKATGPASSQAGVSNILAMQGVQTAAMILQGLVADAVHIIPPMVTPPAWNNQPLQCMPMITGHNCFGAVFHPITAADFVMASATDSTLDGVLASFPQTYKDKVGSTSDSQYQACASAYFSMKCASLFPKCTAPQTGNDATTHSAMRAPMCFSQCISTLVACPGMWLDDIADDCSDISAPPMCSTAFFWRTSLVPSQYESTGAEQAAQRGCPSNNAEAAFGAGNAGAGFGGNAGSVNLPGF